MKTLALLLLLVACKHEQSHREAWQTICDAPKHVTSKNPTDVWAWIDSHVTNEQTRKELDMLATYEGDKREDIRMVLAEVGLDPKRCAMLEN